MKRIVLFLLIGSSCAAQSNQALSLDECIAIALKNNELMKAGKLEVEQARQYSKAWFDLPKTAVIYTQGQFNSVYKYDNNIAINQPIPFPTVFSAGKSLGESAVKEMSYKEQATAAELSYEVKCSYYSLLYHSAIQQLLLKEDSIYKSFLVLENKKYEEGKSTIVEKTSAETKLLEINTSLLENTEEIVNYSIQLQTLMNYPMEVKIKDDEMEAEALVAFADSSDIGNNPYLLCLQQQIEVCEQTRRLERARYMPDFIAGYFNLSIYGPANIGQGDYFLTTKNRLGGFMIGANIPLWFYPYKSRLDAQKIHTSILQSNYNHNKTLLEGELKQNMVLYSAYIRSIDFRKKGTLANSNQILGQALEGFSRNEINYVDYLTIVSSALTNESNYLNTVYKCNLAAFRIQYLMTK